MVHILNKMPKRKHLRNENEKRKSQKGVSQHNLRNGTCLFDRPVPSPSSKAAGDENLPCGWDLPCWATLSFVHVNLFPEAGLCVLSQRARQGSFREINKEGTLHFLANRLSGSSSPVTREGSMGFPRQDTQGQHSHSQPLWGNWTNINESLSVCLIVTYCMIAILNYGRKIISLFSSTEKIFFSNRCSRFNVRMAECVNRRSTTAKLNM